MMIKSLETETIRCINGKLLFSSDKLFVLVVCLNDISYVLLWFRYIFLPKFNPMHLYNISLTAEAEGEVRYL